MSKEEESYLTDICMTECGGMCCAPWWGIVSYSLRKGGGLSRLGAFKAELIKSIEAREKRIRDSYVTREEPPLPPRPLFSAPERYNVAIEDVKISGKELIVTFRAMFAFRCLFLTKDNSCSIHPTLTDTDGVDIRPPHCGYMGSPGAVEGEKGFCRIIAAAEEDAGGMERARAVEEAITLERRSSEKFFSTGKLSAEEAATVAIEELKRYVEKNAPALISEPVRSEKTPGRNDPCSCGSGKKYKKCHGR